MDWLESRTALERKSHFKNLVSVALADGEITDEEKTLLASIGSRLGVSSLDVNEILSKPDEVKFVPPEDDAERVEHVMDMVAMMFVDGDIDGREMVFCKAVARSMGFRDVIVDAIVEKTVSFIRDGADYDSARASVSELL